MSKKTTETKLEKQAEKKLPSDLKDDQLDKAQGGTAPSASASGDVRAEGPRPRASNVGENTVTLTVIDN